MRTFFQKLKIGQKLLTTYAVLTLITIILIMLAVSWSCKLYTQKLTSKTISQTMEQTAINIRHELNNVVNISSIMCSNSLLQNVLSKKETASYRDFEGDVTLLRKELGDLCVTGLVQKVKVYYGPDSSYQGYSASDFDDEKHLLKEWREYTNGTMSWEPFREKNFGQTTYNYLVLIRNITSLSTGEHIGYVTLYINADMISKAIDSIRLGETGFVFIVDQKSRLIAHHDQSLIFEDVLDRDYVRRILEGENNFETKIGSKLYYLTSIKMDFAGWYLIGVTDSMEFFVGIKSMLETVVPITILISILAFVGSMLTTRSITNRLMELSTAMEMGDVSVNMDMEGDEVAFLAKNFNAMQERIQGLIREIKIIEKRKRIADLKALYEQIKPHFIYNTLDSISWLATSNREEDKEKISIIINRLSRMLRVGLNRGQDIIRAEDEIEHAKAYITIQMYRYDNSFKAEFHIDENALPYKVAKLFLQPIIENSINHGFVDSQYKGVLKVTLKEKGENLEFVVSDNGRGCDVKKLRDSLSTVKLDKTSGYGLANVYERLQLYYNGQAKMDIAKACGGGVVVTILIPKKEE